MRTRALSEPLGLADRWVTETKRLAPGTTIGGQLGPRLAVNVEFVKCLADGASIRHARCAIWPLVGHPRRKHTAREAVLKIHTAHMPEVAELPTRDVSVDGVNGHALSECLRRDVVVPHVYIKRRLIC